MSARHARGKERICLVRNRVHEQLGRTDVAVVGELLLVGCWIGLSIRIAGEAFGAPP